jgi:hypothetical protein
MGILSAVPTTIPFGAPLPSIPSIPTIATIPGGASAPFVQSGGSVSVGSGGSLGLASLAGIFVDVLAIVVVLALLGVFVIVVVANRADPDPTGRRPQSVYFFAVSFVTILTSIIGSAVVVSTLTRFIGSHSSPIGDSVARTLVLAGLVTLVSLILLVTHLRRGLTLARADAALTSPSRRVGQTYVSAVAFLSVLVFLVVSVLAVYLVFVIGGPGVFGSLGGGRVTAGRYLIEAAYLGLVAGVILWTHRNLVPPGLHVFGRDSGTGELSGGPPGGAIPPAHVPA